MRSVCVFCGATNGRDPGHARIAHQMGRLLAAAKIELVYGGSAAGCMGALADGASAGRGTIVGIAPRHLLATEQPHAALTRLEVVADLAARKLRMFALSEAIVVLPGGTGTLDELLEALTMKRLGVIAHPIIVLDSGGFFGPLFQLLHRMVDAGFVEASQLQLLRIADSPATVMSLLGAGLTADSPR